VLFLVDINQCESRVCRNRSLADGESVLDDEVFVLVAIGVVCVVTIIISVHGLRRTRTTRDFYVASRRVPPWMNASAIAGEYLSAASFLGAAGLIMASGTDGLWFRVG